MKKTIFSVLSLVLVLLVSSGCITSPSPKTQLEIREFQTRSYDTDDFKMVMKAVMNTLQDDGYIIEQANVDLGLLTGKKEIDLESGVEVFLSSLLAALGGGETRYRKNSTTEASANISEFGDQIRIRINFQVKVLDNKGGVIKIYQVKDEKFYQEFFAKVDKAIFLAKEKL